MDKIGVGIIGFGRIGAEHAAWLTKTAGIEAVAVADGTAARQDLAQKRGLRVYTMVEELLEDRGVQAVLVATPTAMHFEHAMQVMEAGKHVLVEKPMALDLAQSKQMAAEAAGRGVVLSVFQNRRWDLDYLTVRKAVESGVLGKLINVESRLGQWSSCVGPAAREYRPNWRNEAAFGGGGLYDWGSHFVDQIWRLMWPAKPVRVFAQLQGNVWSVDCDDFARVCIDFDNGVAGLVEINTTTTRPLPRWHLDGTAGSAEAPYSLEFDLAKWAELEFAPAGGGTRRLEVAATGLTEVEIWERFGAAVRREGAPAVDPRSALCTMVLLDAARESARDGRVVDLSGLVEWIY
ncbi:MAG: oxidoreductase domain protein [Phycisphaerales bacterium]|nr:oxidoreductase domain protein [Phycisphaerales bacterium]